MAKHVYEVVVLDGESNPVDSIYFDSYKAAKAFKPKTGRVTYIAQWPIYSYKDLQEWS